MHRFERRRFLCISAGALAAIRCVPGSRASEPQPKGSWKPPVAIRDRHLGAAREKDCWAAARALGVDGLEVLVADDLSLPGLFHPEEKYSIADNRSIGELASALKSERLAISAFCLSNRFDERPDVETRLTATTLRAAKALSVPAVRIDVVPYRGETERFAESTAKVVRRILKETQTEDVRLAVENHGDMTNRPEFLDKFFELVDSERIGLTLDTANFYWFGHPLSKVYELYERFAPRTFHTHLKNIRYPEEEREKRRPMGWKYDDYVSPIDDGDIDFRRIVEILRKVRYSGALCIENEALGRFPGAEHKDILVREVRFLRKLI